MYTPVLEKYKYRITNKQKYTSADQFNQFKSKLQSYFHLHVRHRKVTVQPSYIVGIFDYWDSSLEDPFDSRTSWHQNLQ